MLKICYANGQTFCLVFKLIRYKFMAHMRSVCDSIRVCTYVHVAKIIQVVKEKSNAIMPLIE